MFQFHEQCKVPFVDKAANKITITTNSKPEMKDAIIIDVRYNGGQIRKTFVGIWEVGTGKQLEGMGAIPDILVESPPDMEKQGRDMQLEKGIEFLLDNVRGYFARRAIVRA